MQVRRTQTGFAYEPSSGHDDVRNVSWTIKDGKVFETAAIERALGMKARALR